MKWYGFNGTLEKFQDRGWYFKKDFDLFGVIYLLINIM